MLILKQSTAVDVLIGPFVDSTNGYTAETALSPSVKLSKNGQTLAAKNDVTTPVHDADGYYNCELDATDTNTVGTLVLTVVGSATSLPVRHEYQVMEEAAYDAIYGASPGFDASGRVDVGSWLGTAVTTSATTNKPEVDVNSISDDATAANNCELMFDGTGYAGGTTKLGVDVVSVSGDTVAADNLEADYDGTGYNKSASTIGTCTTNTDMITAAAVNAEVDTALSDIGLDHLVSAAVTGTDVTDNSIVAKLVSASATADWDDFVNTTDSLQGIRDRGDAAWTTGAGSGLTPLASGTAQGGSVSTIQLAAGETFADDELNGNVVKVTSGTGAGQARLITDYTGATDTATVSPNWTTTPDATSVYEVVEGSVNVAAWLGTACATPTTAGVPEVDATHVSGTAQTAGDLAALITTVDTVVDGIQTDLDNGTDGLGAIKADTAAILTDTADMQPKLGTPAGASISADIATIDSNVDAVLVDTGTDIPARFDGIEGATFSSATDSLEAIRDRGDAAWITGNTTTPPTAAAIADAVWDELQSAHVTAGSFGEIASEIADILADTNELQTDNVPGLIAALNDLSAAQVNTEVSAVLKTDTIAELTADPGATPTFEKALMLLYMALRNLRETTASADEIHNNAGGVVLTASVNDDGTTFSKGKYA